MLYIAIGILGATVMPHNLYLHSSIVQTRRYELNAAGKREAIKFATIDSTLALMFALFINAAILIVSAATFYTRGRDRRGRNPGCLSSCSQPPARRDWREHTLRSRAPRLRAKFHPHGHSLAGQIVMEGFLDIRHPSMAPPPDHAGHRDCPGDHCHQRLSGEQGTAKLARSSAR